ncbi:hypothetical protein ACFFGH_24925 [Lysobacter korlensis]|uniref:Uncharacterized protein n=1 Tax=Lysobacter korlensis TaxID=553636 RepID=A0ABV6RVS3_9GAMM
MTYAYPEENTLGVPLARRGRRSARAASRTVNRASQAYRGSLGTSYLAAGAIVLVALRAIYGLAWFAGYWESYPEPLLALAAWLALLATGLFAVVELRGPGEHLSGGKFALFLVGITVATGLDLVAVWGLGDIGRYATASVAAGMALLLVLTLRGAVELLISAGLLGAVLATAMVLETGISTAHLAQQIATLAFAVLPTVIGVVLVHGFRRMMQVELDRVLVQSTVSAPRFAVGMLASEELARLDLDAEKLLHSIANGSVPLPLDGRTASKAASLATELRLHLIEGRRETWLYHAITESDLLGKSVTLSDPGSLAGLLDPRQRDGLLSAVWLLVSDSAKPTSARTAQLTLGPVVPETDFQSSIRFPIEIQTTGVSRARVDPSVWEALGKVGSYLDSSRNSSLRVEILCVVARPSDVHTPSRDAGRDTTPEDSTQENPSSAAPAPMER